MSPTAKRVRLAILDGYGVRWSRATFARDVLQNFYDALPDTRAGVGIDLSVDAARGVIEVTGPTLFDLDLLAYVGATTKHDGLTAGGFGEGFKICALIGVRDFGVQMSAGSGDAALEVVLDPVPLGRELCYDIRPRGSVDPAPSPAAVSWVRLAGCDQETLLAFERARLAFRHPTNPGVTDLIAQTDDGRVAVARVPPGRHAEVYYRRQLRGQIRFYGGDGFRGVTLVHDPPLSELDADRDRRDLAPTPIALAIGAALPAPELERVIHHLEPLWRHGHDILSALLRAAHQRGLRFEFPPPWLARSGDSSLDALVERRGHKLAQRAFGDVGMRRASDVIKGGLETRPPTATEAARLDGLARLYAELLGREQKPMAFELFEDERAAVHGQHLGDKIIVDARQLAVGFEITAETVLHELAHEVGGEESDPFLGRLQRLLDAIVKAPEVVDRARLRFVSAEPAPAPVAAAAPPPAPAVDSGFGPERGLYGLSDRSALELEVFTVESFVPTLELVTRLEAAVELHGSPIEIVVRRIRSQAQAVARALPGVPTLRLNGLDLAGPSDEPFGLRLRVRADGELYPSVEALVAAFAEARTSRRKKVVRPRPSVSAHELRKRALDEKCADWAPYANGLAGMWSNALNAVAARRVRVTPDDPRDADAVWSAVQKELAPAIEHARAVRRADPDFDDADAFERDAMVAAQGAALSAWWWDGEGDAAERASATFSQLRRLTGRVLDEPLETRLKREVLDYTFSGACDGYWHYQGEVLAADTLDARFERALAAARRVRDLRRVEGQAAGVFRLADVLGGRDYSYRPDPAVVAQMAAAARASNAVKAAYDEALASHGDPLAAAAAAIAKAEIVFATGDDE